VLANTHGGVELEHLVVFPRQEKPDMLYGERVNQAIPNRFEHRIQICLRAELAAELDQRAAIIVAILVEEIAVELFLEPIPDGLEDKCREENEAHDHRRTDVIRMRE